MKTSLSLATVRAHARTALAVVAPDEKHVIRTSRLLMRPVNQTDFDDYFELLSDPAVMKFIGIKTGRVLGRDEVFDLVEEAIKGWDVRGWGRWSIFTHDGEFIGFCGFRVEQGLPELLTVFHERFWADGIAAEASIKCIEYGRKVFGFGEINAFTNPAHFRAHNLLKKIGAIFQGNVDFHGIVGSKYTFPNVNAAAA